MATLTITNPSLKTGDVLSFTFSGFKSTVTTATLTVSANNDNYGFVEVDVNGVPQPAATSYNIPVGARVVLTAHALGNYQFSSWWDSASQYTTQNPITIAIMAGARGFVATFVAVTPPPPSGPLFPAPGTVGDGNYWYWLVFSDDSARWFDQATYYMLAETHTAFKAVYGPYASGATG
jgi:hypothetical protein